jgi:protein TonB
VAAAPSPGAAAEALRAQASWTKLLIAQLDSHKRYPGEARAQGHRGTVSIQFSLDRAGHLMTANVLKSSGSRHLDEEALALMKRAGPLPAPPEDLANVALTLPINFNIK